MRPRQTIQSVALRCQILIEAARRRYYTVERESLRDLFGEPDRWSQTLRSLLWSQRGITVPVFSGGIVVQLPVLARLISMWAQQNIFMRLRG